MKSKYYLIMVLAVVSGLSGLVFADCEALVTETLTDGGDNTNIKVSGNNAVWVGTDLDGYKQIFFYNGNSVEKLTDSNSDNIKPQINGKKIVWQGQNTNGGDWEIFFYKGGCIQQITDNNADDINPKLSGTRIFWERHDGNDSEIMSAAVPKAVMMKVMPRTINLKSNGQFITVQLLMNDSAEALDVNISSLKLFGSVPAAKVAVFERLNTLTIKFGRPEVQALLTTGNSVEIILTGKLGDGTVFTASDTVRVISPGK